MANNNSLAANFNGLIHQNTHGYYPGTGFTGDRIEDYAAKYIGDVPNTGTIPNTEKPLIDIEPLRDEFRNLKRQIQELNMRLSVIEGMDIIKTLNRLAKENDKKSI